MFLFAFAVLGTQAAAGTVSVSYELNGETVSFSGATLREVNVKMRTYWEVNGDGCAYNAEKLPADGTGTLTWKVSGTVEQGAYLGGGALVLPSLSGGYIYRDGTYRWKKIEVKADAPGATIISNPTFDVGHSYFSTGTNTTTVTGVTLQGGLYVVPHGTVTFDGCTFTGQLRVPNGDGAFAVTGCTFTGATAAQDSDGYVMHYQAAGTLAFSGNTVADGYRRGLNIDNKDLTATVEKNKLGTTTDAGRSAIQISKCVKLAVTGNEIKLNGGNAFTFHEALLGLSAAPEVSISGNTVTGTGYLVYDDAVANGKAFTSDNLKLTYATDNVVAATVDTTQGVKGAEKYALSGTVATTLHSVDFAAFVDALKAANNTFDGSKHALAQGGKLTVKWSPVSGCYDTREGHECTVGNVAATANTPKRVNSGLTQFQLFEGESHAVNVKNVAFVYEPAAFTVCENSGWKGTFTAEQAPAGQIYLMNTGNVTFEGCSFDKVVLTSFNCTDTSTVTNCSFKDVYNSYAVKDIRGKKVAVTGCTFENCGAAVMVSMVSSTVKVGAVTISGNNFKNVDVVGTAPDDKVGTRGLVQIASSGDYAGTAFDFSGNTATDCGPVLRQLNTTVSFGTEEKAQLNTLASAGGSLYTTDSIKRVVAKVGETAYETLDEAIKAVRDGETIVVNAGEYKLNGSLTYTGKAFTIQAAEGAKVSFDMSGAVALHGAKITFTGVTFDYKTNGNYIGLQHADTLVYNDCTINGMVFLYAASETFNRCTFNQTSAGAYNVWTYGAKEVAFNVCTFNCVGKSVLVYNEGANTKADLAVSDCEFKASAPVEGKAAIEIDTSLMAGGATITVDAKTTAEGFAEGSNSKSTLWNDKKQTQDTNRNTTVTVAGETVFTPVVAQVGTTGYTTLAAAFAVLSAENHTLTLLNENAWDAATPVYWAAGTQSGYAKTLTEALTAAYKADAGAITVVCRPGADVGEMTHGHVADDLTIYGNDAYLSGGECDLEVDTYTFSRATGKQAADGVCLDKDITITAYELDNLGVWGERHTANKVTVNLTDCDGKALEGKTNVQRVYISGTTGVNDITLTDCDFLTKATAVYSNADGAIKAVNCSFTGGEVPFNINHKANGTQTVAVENCTFTNCGDAGGWKQFAAPLRLVNSGAGTQSAEVTGCAFADTVGANGDILLGDGRTGQASNDVELKVVNTAANIQAQKPGYYGVETVDATKKATATSPASGTLETSVAKLLPVDPRTLGYATSGKAEALPAAPDMSGEVVNVTAAQAQYVLDGAYGPIDGKTINFTESINDTLILGRASKYDGSKTVYRHGSHAGEALSYADFIAYKNQSVWTESCYYERTVENVTFTANEGVTVKNFEADGGAHIYAGTAPVYDYVRDTGSWVTEGSCYFKRAILKNITFKGLTFKAKTDINTSESTTVYDGFTFKDCTFDLGTTADGNQAIRYYNENNNGNVKNLVVEGCTFKTCSQGVYTAHVKNVTVTGSTFDTTGHNAIAIQDFKGACDHGEVVITGNTFKGIGDRIIRFNNVGLGTTVTIKDNTADGNSGKLDEATGKREIVKATTLPVNAADSIKASGNNWGANTVVEGVFIDDYATKLGTEACPYSREQFAAMTRAEYIAAQERLGGTLYVNVGDYAYEKDGVLGNGVRNDTPGQVPDHSKLNAYGENGYLGEKNDGANGQTVVFVGGTITSGVTGYTSIDSIGTSLLLAVPAYTKVTFKGTAFKNVLSFDYQLYTSPWSQLGGLTFNGCTFDGIIVGAIASQELAFNGCTFNNYVNTTDANSSNPTWIRPAYGNWTKGDNEGQGTDFRSLTKITFENNKVTSTRPVKFERIAQWEMETTVRATDNAFDITPQEGDTSPKNVGLYFGANAKFDLVADNNTKSDGTAALYTAAYKAPNGTDYDGLPAGSTVKNAAGEVVTIDDARVWKKTDTLTLKTTTEVASVTNAKGVSVNFATLADAIAAAQDGETVKLLADTNGDGIAIAPNTFKTGLTVDFGGHTYTVGGLLVGSSGTASNGFQLNAGNRITFKNGAIVGATATAGTGTDWKGAPAILIQNYCDLTLEQMTVKGGDETCYTLSNNNGEIVIDGSTIVAGKGTKYGPFAFDVCRYANYPSVHVTVKGASVIDGDVEISGTIGDNQSRQLDIEGGTFRGAFTVAGNIPANIAISGGTFATAIDETYCAAGFIPTKNADGTYGVKEGAYVAEIGTVKYETVDAAMEAAAANETATTVMLLAESVDETVVPTWYIKGDVTVDADSAVKATFAPIENAADAPDTDGMAYIASDDAEKARTITVGEKVTLSFPNTAKETGAFYIGYGKDGNWAPTHLVLNGRIEAYEPYIGAGSSLTVSKTGSLKSLSECLLMRRGSTVTVTGTDGAWSAEKPQVALGYGSQQGGEVTFKDTFVTGGAFWTMWNRNGNADVATKLTLDNTAFTAGAFKGTASSGETSAYEVELKNSSRMTISGDFGVIAEGSVTIEAGSLIIAKSIDNAGTFIVDATGITAPVKVFDYTGTVEMTLADYGAVNVVGGEAYVEDGDLWVRELPVAKIGETVYGSLADAVVAAQGGDTVTLLTDVALTEALTLDKDLTLDLGGKTVTAGAVKTTRLSNDGCYAGFVVNGSAQVAVKNGTLTSAYATYKDGTTSASYSSYVVLVDDTAHLTLDGVCVVGQDAGDNYVRASGGICYDSTGSLTLKSCTVSAGASNGKGYNYNIPAAIFTVSGCDGTLVVDATTVTGGAATGIKMDKDGSAAINVNGGVDVTVSNGSKLVGGGSAKTAGNALEARGSGTLKVSDSTLQGGSSTDGIGGSALYVTSSTVTAEVTGATLVGGDGGTSWDGSGVVLNKAATVTITDSTVKSGRGENATGNAAAITLPNWESADLTLSNVSLSGSDRNTVIKNGLTDGIKLAGDVTVDAGTLKNVAISELGENVSIMISEGAAAEEDTIVSLDPDRALVKDSDVLFRSGMAVAQVVDSQGNKMSYATLASAIAAAEDGETVKLLADVTESVTIAADRTLTLDLNGKTLSAGKASEALTVTGHLTIDDTSAAKSGRVVGDGRYAVYMNNRTAHVGEAAVGGSLTLNAGSLEGATYGVYILANQAAFTMNGGKVSATKEESIRVNNDYHAKTISLLGGEVGNVFLGSISSTELTTLTVGKADQTDPAAVKVGKIGLQYNRGLFRLELYNGLVGELPEIGSCTATYTALGMLVKSDANCPSGKVFEAIDYNGETWYRIAALQKIAITFDDSKTVALPFATDWLKAHVGKGEASWTTAALEEKAANELAKWQCYLFGLDPNKKEAKVVATAGQGTDEKIPLAVANADASASPLVKDGYVTVAYVLMGSNDRTAWTQVATSNKRDGLAIPLTGTTYKFYRVDVTVTSAEGN